jgi:hypothetical protein
MKQRQLLCTQKLHTQCSLSRVPSIVILWVTAVCVECSVFRLLFITDVRAPGPAGKDRDAPAVPHTRAHSLHSATYTPESVEPCRSCLYLAAACLPSPSLEFCVGSLAYTFLLQALCWYVKMRDPLYCCDHGRA